MPYSRVPQTRPHCPEHVGDKGACQLCGTPPLCGLFPLPPQRKEGSRRRGTAVTLLRGGATARLGAGRPFFLSILRLQAWALRMVTDHPAALGAGVGLAFHMRFPGAALHTPVVLRL